MEKAFLFDLNGTMIDDMQFHLKAWYHILNDDLGANLSWEEVKSHMYGKNSELLIRIFGKDRFTPEEMDRLSIEKEKRYQQEYKPHLKLIPGLQQFLEKAHALNIPMAIGSAAIMFNIDFVLDNLNIRHFFKAIVSADNVHISKPHPETYLKAAQNAGMSSVVLTLLHEKEEFATYNGIIKYITDYIHLAPAGLLQTMAV